MRRLTTRRILALGLVAIGAVVAVGFAAIRTPAPTGRSVTDEPIVEVSGDPRTFVAVARRDLGLDYEPLRDAVDATKRADVIVRGTVVDLVDGPVYRFPEKPPLPGAGASQEDLLGNDEALASYETADIWFTTTVLWVEVGEVLRGDGIEAGDRIPVHVLRSPSVPFSEVADTRFRADGLFIMTDKTRWQPFDGVVIEWPESLPDHPLLMPFPDGLWLDGGDELVAIHAEPDELRTRWGLDTVGLDALVAALREATD